jgi:Ca2+/H+ antiporter
MLLIPGASMVAGGIKNKEQRFNQITAGVSSVLLIVSITGIHFSSEFLTLQVHFCQQSIIQHLVLIPCRKNFGQFHFISIQLRILFAK